MIREFRMSDIDRVMELWLDSNILAHSFIDKKNWLDNFQMVKEMMPQATIYVYEEDGEIQGFIGLMEDYIAGIFVSAKLQSRGIGKLLLDYAKGEHSQLMLAVYKQNNSALRFYLREGFNISTEKIDEGTGEIELIMKWRESVSGKLQ